MIPFSAHGGVKTTDGLYTVHTFAATDILHCTGTIEAEVLVVGAGGGGSSGGGGAGGWVTGTQVLRGDMPITVGVGGTGSNPVTTVGVSGGDSGGLFATAKGGGGGQKVSTTPAPDGGSGGGAAGSSGGLAVGGTATPSWQGHNGGTNGSFGNKYPSGGGGGAGSVGGNATTALKAGNGGAGIVSDFIQRGTSANYAGGGAGALYAGGAAGAGAATHGGGPGGGTDWNGGPGTTPGSGGGGAGNGKIGGAGANGIVVVRYLTIVPIAPTTSGARSAQLAPRLSLMVGSDALGWADLGDSAVIGERTKGMPGGDGSLSFTLPPDVAAKARNQLQHKARVKLTANGAPDFGGRICSDPFGDVLSPVKDAVTVECSGLWAWADRYGAFAWVWNDSDTAQWATTTQVYDEGSDELIASGAEAAKYTADTEGRLFILANSGEAFAPYSNFHLNYWLLGGLETGCEIVGLDVEYMCNLPVLTAGGTPGPWKLWFHCNNNPWDMTYYNLNGTGEVTSRTSWYAQSFDLAPGDPNQCLSMSIWRGGATAGPVNEVVSDPWVWVKSVVVRCRMDGATVDRTVYLSDVLCDMATKPGLATVTAGEVISLGTNNNQIAVRSMTGIRSGMADLAGQNPSELEYWFDLDEAGADRFNHYGKPAAADPTRNSCWSYGDAAGESVAGLDHDPELCPDWIRMTYLSDGVTSIPDGTPRDVWYPATQPTDYSESARVVTEFSGQMLTDAHAAALAQRVHARIDASEWSGSVPVPFTMTDVAGRERGGWQVRQGDRISVPSLDGAGDLYLTEVSWNWTTLTGSATVGYPWEVAGMLGPDATAAAPFVTPPLPEPIEPEPGPLPVPGPRYYDDRGERRDRLPRPISDPVPEGYQGGGGSHRGGR